MAKEKKSSWEVGKLFVHLQVVGVAEWVKPTGERGDGHTLRYLMVELINDDFVWRPRSSKVRP